MDFTALPMLLEGTEPVRVRKRYRLPIALKKMLIQTAPETTSTCYSLKMRKAVRRA